MNNSTKEVKIYDLRHNVNLSDGYKFSYFDTNEVVDFSNKMYNFANEYNEICSEMKKNDAILENAVTGTPNKAYAKAQSITTKSKNLINNTKVDGYYLDDTKLTSHLFDKSQTTNYQRYDEAKLRVTKRLQNARTQNNATEISKCESDVAKLDQAINIIRSYGNSAYVGSRSTSKTITKGGSASSSVPSKSNTGKSTSTGNSSTGNSSVSNGPAKGGWTRPRTTVTGNSTGNYSVSNGPAKGGWTRPRTTVTGNSSTGNYSSSGLAKGGWGRTSTGNSSR